MTKSSRIIYNKLEMKLSIARKIILWVAGILIIWQTGIKSIFIRGTEVGLIEIFVPHQLSNILTISIIVALLFITIK